MLAAAAASWDEEVGSSHWNSFSYTMRALCQPMTPLLWIKTQEGQELEATDLGKVICPQVPGETVEIKVRDRLKGWEAPVIAGDCHWWSWQKQGLT